MGNQFNERVKILAKLGFSIAFLILGIVLIFSDDPSKKTMGGSFLGIVIGYWVK